MTFRFISAEKANHRVATMCRVLCVSRSGFYAWHGRSPSDRALSDLVLAGRIASIDAVSDSTYGVPRIQMELRDDGILVSRRRVARLMREGELGGRLAASRQARDDRAERRAGRRAGPCRAALRGRHRP